MEETAVSNNRIEEQCQEAGPSAALFPEIPPEPAKAKPKKSKSLKARFSPRQKYEAIMSYLRADKWEDIEHQQGVKKSIVMRWVRKFEEEMLHPRLL